MNVEQAIARLEALQAAFAALIATFAAADPEPKEIERLNAEIAALSTGLDQVQPTPSELPRLIAVANETDRLARAAAAASGERRVELTAEQAQTQRTVSALGAYRPVGSAGQAIYFDRRS